ncbi:MAG: DUF1501 domain-containing protein [Planctomycetota bacterium]|nr:MAG: DUF1501 domain-containing protein [Planctomycetota bacterium]
MSHPRLIDWSRRDALRVMAASGLSFLLPAIEGRAAQLRGAERPTSFITLWMQGGPSQLDTWDPQPGSKNSDKIRAIATSATGVQIAHLFPRMAEQMKHLSIVRSLTSKEGDHERGTYYVQTAYLPDPTTRHPAISAVLASELPDSRIEIPNHVALASGDGFTVPRGGYLGDQFDAFRVFDPGLNLQNMQQRVETPRQNRRLENLQVVSNAFRVGREARVASTLHQPTIDRALTMMKSDQLTAFEIDRESKETRDRYGDSRFGRGCLVARRLVETGVRSIQVVLSGFDTHANNYEGHVTQAAILDPAFAALTQDLADRDLLASTIVLCIGEFGRTPQINPLGGRDHWPHGFSCVIGGGGFRAGQVFGASAADNQSDKNPIKPSDPIEVPDLYATILNQMGVEFGKELITPIGRPLKICPGKVIEKLLV